MRSLVVLLMTLLAAPVMAELNWDRALGGDHRSDRNKARDEFRHPRATLEFFGLSEGMTVVELSPGGGWYTEVLAPLLQGNGTYYAAHYSANDGSYQRRALGGFLRKLGENGDVYGEVRISTLSPSTMEIAPDGSADMVLAFRNIHSWMGSKTLDATFAASFAALKPGGVFGVVQHRARDDRTVEAMRETAYVSEAHVVAAARRAGFELDARTEINANPKDPADHKTGVWELPPSLRGDESEREAMRAIGESDRMTLRFLKPAG